MLAHRSQLLRKSVLLDLERIENWKKEAPIEDEEITTLDLVDCLFEGNIVGIENYLKGLAPKEQQSKRESIKRLLESIMEEKGIESFPEDPAKTLTFFHTSNRSIEIR